MSGVAAIDDDAARRLGLIDRAEQHRGLWSIAGGVFAYRELLRNLVFKDLNLKYRGSLLGFMWSLVNPLVLTAVYTLAFRYILHVGQAGYSFFVLLGVLAWSFFGNSLMMATGAFVEGGSLIKAVRFPRALLPIATVLFNLAQYLLSSAVFLPIMLVFRRLPSMPVLLLFPVVLAMQIAFTIGLAVMLAVATAWFRDVRHFVELLLVVLFWTTPIVYPIAQVPPAARTFILLSPMSPFIVAYQRILYEGVMPEGPLLIVAAMYALITPIAGGLWLSAVEDRLVEQL